MTTLSSYSTKHTALTGLLDMPGLVACWDFNGANPYQSIVGKKLQLQEGNGQIELKNEGILSTHSINIKEGQYLFIPRKEAGALNIYGKNAGVTVLAWVKRQRKSYSQCEAIAGMWNETAKQRQYCLFLDLSLYNSANQVCGHISGVGGPTQGQKWCMDASIGKTEIRYNEWYLGAFTYDGHQIKSYINGQLDTRPERNPYIYKEGIFEGGENGSDFTVAAVHRQGEMGNYFVGQMGGLAVFNRAVSATEMQLIYESFPLPEQQPTQIAEDNYKVIAGNLAFPEGPAFAPDGSLWAVELKGGKLVHYTGDTLTSVAVGGGPNGIAIDRAGKVWFCDALEKSIRCLDPVSGNITTKLATIDSEPLNKPNDLAFDSEGNLLFTCPGESRTEPTGYAGVLTKEGHVKKFTDGKFFPNGLAFTPDGQWLVLAETYKHRLWKGRWDARKAEWINAAPWCDTGGPDGPGGPDGMCFDADGNLFVAVFGTGKVKKINTEGKIIKEITMPGQRPTNCAFDPKGVLGLVVTEAETGRLISLPVTEKGAKLFY